MLGSRIGLPKKRINLMKSNSGLAAIRELFNLVLELFNLPGLVLVVKLK